MKIYAALLLALMCLPSIFPLSAKALPQTSDHALNSTQSPAEPNSEEFEVATIKPTAPDWNRGRFIRMEGAHQLVVRNHVLRTLIAAAYNLNPKTVTGGPAWIDSEHYDIDRQMAMLQTLLADRFDLKFHREERQLPIYALKVANAGPKLKASTASAGSFPQGPPPLLFVVALPTVNLPARYATTAELASVFQRTVLDRPVIDETGLVGRYDFDLEFTPGDVEWNGAFAGRTPTDADKPGLWARFKSNWD
ncbi:MAG: TIGR03435 family protein [Candidatus Acidiferrales bacterium]